MKEIMKKIYWIAIVLLLIVSVLCSCGQKGSEGNNSNENNTDIGSFDSDAKANVDFFEWDGNIITAVTAEGSKQESILIPAKCEGFTGVIFQNTEIKHIAFEDNDDISLDFAFMGAENVVSIDLPDNLTIIPSMCFQGSKSLKSISIPATVNTLEGYSFSACSSLEDLIFEGTNITVIGENCFEDCTSLNKITIPDGVEKIEKYAFADCSAVTKIELSSSVKEIAKFAFGNTGITEIHFPVDIQFEMMDASAFGTTAYTTVVYISQGSWCDQNQDKWDIGFSEIKYE